MPGNSKSKTIYLDYAAATPIHSSVKLLMEPYFEDKFFNPSANYLAARQVAKDIESARADIAVCMGCRPSEVVFTAGGTEANNLAVKGVMELYPSAELIVSAIEHESVIQPAKGFKYKLAKVDELGLLDTRSLIDQINDNVVLISIIYANNEIGTIQPIHKIAKEISVIRKDRKKRGITLPIYLHIDACQAPLYLDVHVSSLGVDLMTLNSGKIYGPKQFGALYISRNVKLKPQILGGGQENGLRSGTESPANIVGFAEALKVAQSMKNEESARLLSIQEAFIQGLQKSIPKIEINGSLKNRLPNNVNIVIPGQDNELLLMKLDELRIQCASGSACNANSDELSHTLKAIGLTDDNIRSSLRFTMGRATTLSDINFVTKALVNILD